MEYILETNNLEKRYKDFKALEKFNIHIEKGAIYGLIGKNGAGKTTLIRLITGLQNPSKGTYSIYGVKNTDSKILEQRKRIGAIVETPALYLNLTAKENLIEQYQILGIPSKENIDELLKFVGLSNTGTKKVKNFSLGMRQRLAIAIAISGHPDFLILDEPINGLDPQGIIEIRELILKLNKEKNMTVLISSHYLDELSKIATNYGFVDGGHLIKEISSEELNKICKKKITITVNNVKECVKYLEEENIQYEVIDDKTISIYGKIYISKLCLSLDKRNCEIIDMQESNESLENYYINLIGGRNND